MISFRNDYCEGAHEQILKALQTINTVQNGVYGEDDHCERAAALIREQCHLEYGFIHFLEGGTQTNLTFISHCLKPYQAVISADTGHINTHETGAIEATGHKVLTCPTKDGKLKKEMILKILDEHTDEHMVQPKMVYISNPTEVGTLYTKAELTALWELCQEKKLLFYLDGARMASALASPANDITLTDYAAYTDAFYIGGTKCGAFMGEALVITNKDLEEDFRFSIKQKGGMMAKGWILGVQFEELFSNGLYVTLGEHANHMAAKLKNAILEKGYDFLIDSETNQQFPIFPNDIIASLSRKYEFNIWERIDEERSAVRLVTSWATKEENVDAFIKDFCALIL